jgi:hypothetical protein
MNVALMTPSPRLLLAALAGLLSIGASFGLIWWRTVRVNGARSMLIGWVVSSIVFAIIGASRASAFMRRFGGLAASRTAVLTLSLSYAAFGAVFLAPSALALVRRARKRPDSSTLSVASSSAAWSLLGFVLVIICGFMLEVLNVPLMRLPRRSSPPPPPPPNVASPSARTGGLELSPADTQRR